MRKHLAIASAVALLAGAGVASAAGADEQVSRILDLDTMAGTLTLDDGMTYTLDEGVSLHGLQAGEEVTVSFEEGPDGQQVISRITSHQEETGDDPVAPDDPAAAPDDRDGDELDDPSQTVD